MADIQAEETLDSLLVQGLLADLAEGIERAEIARREIDQQARASALAQARAEGF